MRLPARFFPLLCLAFAPPATAQTGIWLEWSNVGLTLYPGSAGVFMWAGIHAPPGQRQPSFSASFDPGKLEEWLPVARGFNSQPMATSSDTARYRISPVLHSIIGDGVYLVRRRDSGVWSDERFLLMESIKENGGPVVITGSEKTVGQILDSLEAIGKRTKFSPLAAQREIRETVLGQYDREASPSPLNQPPEFPMTELRAHRSGMVVVSFFIDANGRADMSTVQRFFSSGWAFYESVLAALPTMYFFPAEKDGKKVRSKVTMPFTFTVIR